MENSDGNNAGSAAGLVADDRRSTADHRRGGRYGSASDSPIRKAARLLRYGRAQEAENALRILEEAFPDQCSEEAVDGEG